MKWSEESKSPILPAAGFFADAQNDNGTQDVSLPLDMTTRYKLPAIPYPLIANSKLLITHC